VPFAELPRLDDPECGYVITANNRIAADDYPHHLTSEYLDGARARRIEVLIERSSDHDVDSFARMQLDTISAHGLETARRLARLEPRGQAEVSAIERLRSWDGRMSTNSIAASIYQAFTLRLGREVARRAIGDRDLAERWLGRADNGFMTHVLGTWRWQSHLLDLWAKADPELIGGSWDDLALDALRGALDDLADRFGTDSRAWRWGAVHRIEFPHALGLAHPLLARLLNRSAEVGGGQETIAQVGWEPSRPFTATWAPAWRIVADPADPSLSRWQQFTGNSGHPGSTHYDDLLGRWRDGLTQPIEGEGPWRELRLEPAASGVGAGQPGDLP
jgi:penicillin amidase